MGVLIESTTFLTDIGKIRSHNEDNGGIFSTDVGTLAVVADGMGGHSAGDVASRIATEVLEAEWQAVSNELTASEAETFLQNAFKHVNDAIYHYAKEHPECEGMGTTAIAALCTQEYTTVAHVGDSRAYVFDDKQLKQVTHDHSLVAELVRTGQISEEEADHHPRKNVVLRALGTEEQVKIDSYTLQSDLIRVLMICSDGLSNKLKTSELQVEVEREDELSAIAKSLVARANDRGGEDNISIALVRFDREIGE
ncbi:Stp1/IreP family PP2C-type Ser/Thr phosphatase [Shouchella xiaoxiensis]|uniref:Stp1/IreP family PP2C-type Ser/Thr phosphatase n=1 Tax=Shouchella xiaoxiensis TaxID=766895 RepID=UPI002AA4F6E0